MADKIVILGAGVSGNGTAVLAKKHGYDVFVSDTLVTHKSTGLKEVIKLKQNI